MQRPWGSKELGSQGSERVRVKGQRVSGEGVCGTSTTCMRSGLHPECSGSHVCRDCWSDSDVPRIPWEYWRHWPLPPLSHPISSQALWQPIKP